MISSKDSENPDKSLPHWTPSASNPSGARHKKLIRLFKGYYYMCSKHLEKPSVNTCSCFHMCKLRLSCKAKLYVCMYISNCKCVIFIPFYSMYMLATSRTATHFSGLRFVWDGLTLKCAVVWVHTSNCFWNMNVMFSLWQRKRTIQLVTSAKFKSQHLCQYESVLVPIAWVNSKFEYLRHH